MNKPITFEIAKLLKDKGIDIQCWNFYTKPNSKMFGIDEHYRNYPIKNTSKKLYTVGEHAVLNFKNLFYAPTIAEVVMWIYEKHGIWISVTKDITVNWANNYFNYYILSPNKTTGSNIGGTQPNTPTEAYLAAIEYTLNNLI
jgi:hypothetical protein